MPRPTRILVLLLTLAVRLPVSGAAEPPDQLTLERLAQAQTKPSLELLRQLLSLPSDANFPEHVAANVAFMRQVFEEREFTVRRLETGGLPLLLAEKKARDASRTVLVYLQIDGQPVDPSHWDQEDPWKPVLKERTADGWREIPWSRLAGDIDPEWRIFARAAADAKGPAVAFLAALDAAAAAGLHPSYHLKVIMDFAEELGSPNLPEAVSTYREALAADALIIYDGPRHATDRPTLHFGARGIATVNLTVFGPRLPQHSGHYGNYAPNPAMRLAQLLASMKDDDGRVTLPGFYDGVVLDEETKAILAQVPNDEEEIRERLGIAVPDRILPDGVTAYEETIQYPSLNIRGMASGWVGSAARTIVPATATAALDVRLVPEVDANRLIAMIRQHVVDQGYHVLDNREPTDEERRRYPRLASFSSTNSYQAFRTDYDSEVGVWLHRALTRAFNEQPVRIRMAGGSIPIAPFINTLGVPSVSVPIVQLDNNQHSPNENLRLGNYTDGIRTYLAVLSEPFGE